MEFLEEIILDNTLKSYLIVFVIITVVLLFKRLLSHYVASLLFLVIKKNWKTLEKKEFVSLTIKPLSWLLVIVVADFAIEKLNYPRAWNFKIHGVAFNDILEKIGNSAMIVALFYFLISLINFISLLLHQKSLADKDKSHGQIVIFFRDLLKVLVGIIGLLFVLRSAFNQNIGTLLTGLSIVGAALALAAKESIENIIASFIIFFDKPFFTGDTLKVNNVAGTVERIGLRSTRIRTLEKTLVTVPNKQMVDSVVDNLSMRNQRRAEIKLALSDKTKPDEVQTLIDTVKNILTEKQEDIIKSSVFLTEYNKDGVTITIEYFTQPFTMNEFNKVKQLINFKLMYLMEEQHLAMSSSASNITIVNNEGDGGAPKQQPIL
ncbi:MAG: mechanosensitive ion channel [Ferruginibacter sp.]|nr:mechanosensitive ion channel [Ferruginibacter sp.]